MKNSMLALSGVNFAIQSAKVDRTQIHVSVVQHKTLAVTRNLRYVGPTI